MFVIDEGLQAGRFARQIACGSCAAACPRWQPRSRSAGHRWPWCAAIRRRPCLRSRQRSARRASSPAATTRRTAAGATTGSRRPLVGEASSGAHSRVCSSMSRRTSSPRTAGRSACSGRSSGHGSSDLSAPSLTAPDAIAGVGTDHGRRVEDLLEAVTPTADPALLPVPGEDPARERLARWAASSALDRYATDRDRLDLEGTSRLGQDLRWGLISPSAVGTRCAGPGEGRRRFLSELAWRDFYAHLLWHEPRLARASFRPSLDRVAWEHDPRVIDAWPSRSNRLPGRRRGDAPAPSFRLDAQPGADDRGIVPDQASRRRLAGGRAALHGAPRRRRSGQQQRRLAVGGVDGDGRTTVVPDLQPDAPGDPPRSRRGVCASVGPRAGRTVARGDPCTATRGLRRADRRAP